MKNLIRLLTLFILLGNIQAHAAKVELEFNGQKQVVEFDQHNETDMDRVWVLWRKSDNQKSYVYSETGIFRMYDEPRDDAKSIEIGSWYQEINSRFQQSPELAHINWDKRKWFSRLPSLGSGWIKLDDPNLIWPSQLKPVKEWPIRYIAYYRGTDTAAAEEGLKPKYDEYIRYQFDREGYLLDNRTMKRKKTSGGNLLRFFYFRDFVKITAVSPNDVEISVSTVGGGGLAFNLKQALLEPKIEYDKDNGFISVWGSFDDPVQPVLDKNHHNVCVIDCKSRKRWEP